MAILFFLTTSLASVSAYFRADTRVAASSERAWDDTLASAALVAVATNPEGDPDNRGQDVTQLLGKMVRIDVNSVGGNQPDCGGSNYTIPANNPFVDGPGGVCDEIWAYGLRNPWRFSFDRLTGELFIGDVGQHRWEEIDYQPAASSGGENYGWRLMEGPECHIPPKNCNDGSLTLPILSYSHRGGRCAVTGGYPYRGTALPQFAGAYFFSDYCSGQIWAAHPDGSGDWRVRLVKDTNFIITTFGEDEAGELCFNDYRNAGTVYCLLP